MAGVATATAATAPRARAGRSRSKVGLLPDAREVAARSTDPADLSAVECAALLQAGVVSSRELTAACLARIAKRDERLNGWVRLYPEAAEVLAREADARLSLAARRRTGRRAPLLCGIPLGLKDIFAVAGLPLTAGSKLLEGNHPDEDSEAWRRLRFSGAVAVGHTQTHEFAAGNFTPQSANPWDPTRTPGGSSGGSGIAVSTRMVPLATGSDTLGSLRIPASLCGVSALKPTFGLISRTGVTPLAHSFDHIGPMARSEADLGLLLSYLAGADPRDEATTGPHVRAFFPIRSRGGRRPLEGIRIGVPDKSFGGLRPTPAIAERVERFATELVSLGARLVAFTAPRSPAENLSSPAGFAFFASVPGAEIDGFHRRFYPQRATEYTPDVAFTLGLLRAFNTPAHDPAAGAHVVAALRAAWVDAFTASRLDAVLQPAALIETPRREDAQSRTQTIGDPMVVWNYIGFPALCLPAGPSRDSGLPVGVQLIAAPERDALLLRIGIEAQASFPHHEREPPAEGAG